MKITKTIVEDQLKKVKSENKKTLPVIYHLIQPLEISDHSLKLVKNRINTSLYGSKHASKMTYYKPISLIHPEQD